MASVSPSPGVTLELHKRETAGSGYWGHPGICTVTFCEGDPNAAHAALRDRMLAVLTANPWAAGKLERKRLVHPIAASMTLALVDEVLFLRKCAAVHRGAPYPQLVKAVATNPALAVQSGDATKRPGPA